jgi:DNA-directed RNA polymerase beta' subunit
MSKDVIEERKSLKDIKKIGLKLASADKIREWSHGEVQPRNIKLPYLYA